MRKPHIPHPHLKRHHYIKLTITAGCLVSSCIVLLFPHHETHAVVIATATNVFWAWS